MEFKQIENEVRKRKAEQLEAKTAKTVDDKARAAQKALEAYQEAVRAYEEEKIKARSLLKTPESYQRMCARRFEGEPVPDWPFLSWLNRLTEGRMAEEEGEEPEDPIFCPACGRILALQKEDRPAFCSDCGTKIRYKERRGNV